MENEQIDIILQNEGLNASQLAERLNIQRAQISHLQSNRNRVSLDVVKKIHHAFPHIRLEWLIDHEGDYWNPDATPFTSPFSTTLSSVPSDGMGDLFGDNGTGIKENENGNKHRHEISPHPSGNPQMVANSSQQTAKSPQQTAENPKKSTKDAGSADFLKENEEKEPSYSPKEAGNLSIQMSKKTTRKVVELKVFYNDGTYETFVERKGE